MQAGLQHELLLTAAFIFAVRAYCTFQKFIGSSGKSSISTGISDSNGVKLRIFEIPSQC